MSKIEWKSEKRLLKDLIPAPYNPRQLTEKQASDLNKSLTKFNLADPIVINQDNKIIGGHQRINILKTQGVTEVDVRVPQRLLTEAEEKELNLRLNKNLGEWDFDALANFDEDMLKEIGFDSKELDTIFQLEPEPKDDAVPEVRETDIKLGDMFQLGEHMLLCGDATKKEDVEKLMSGEKADMVFTDPPYGIDLIGKSGAVGGDGKLGKSKIYRAVENDGSVDIARLSYEVMKNYSDNLIIWGGNYFTDFLPVSRCWLIWDKKRPPQLTFCGVELAWTSYDKHPIKYEWLWDGGKREGSKKDELNSRVHPTQKPVGLHCDILEDFSKRDNIIIDPFGGSGSILIACEKLNRKCRMMEIDPIYCQVIIDRWEQYAEKKAEKINAN